MKSVVMIAYGFPPEGTAGVYRPLRFVRNLEAYGWISRVVSSGSRFQRYDAQLLSQVPASTEVVRIPHGDVWQSFQMMRSERLRRTRGASTSNAPAPVSQPKILDIRSRLRTLVRAAESAWYHPDMQKSWIRPAVAATVAMCARSRPDALWATGPPWSAFIVAQRASERTGVPYVLDFRTSWTIVPSPFEAMRPAWAQRMDRHRLTELLRRAHAVTFFYAAEAECFWRMYRGVLDVERIHIIPNGFDGEVEAFVPPATKKFTILYTGTLSDYRYDTFLAAVARFISSDPARAQCTSIQFVGEEDPALGSSVKKVGLSEIVSTRPPVPHAEIAGLQREAHVLLMLERQPTHKGYELLAGAKLFGYLKAGRPILGVLPRGEAERVLHEVGVSTIADAASVETICAVLEAMFNGWRAGRLSSFVPDRAACEQYSATCQTAALVRALEGSPPLQLFVPGAVEIAPSLRAELPAAGWA